MNKGNLFWAVLVVGVLLGFFLGRWVGHKDVQDVFIDNPEMVKEIAELSTLEVLGSARMSQSNIALERNFWNDLSDYMGERTLTLDVPYQAKYGVDLAKSDLKITKGKDKIAEIVMEKPKLMSLEMRLDKMQQFSKNGALVFQRDDKFKLPVQKLYSETKDRLNKNQENIKLSMDRIEVVLKKFFTPLGMEFKMKWVK